MDLDFDNFWTTTDEYPILQWQVQDVDLEVAQPAIGEGETTDVTVKLTLEDGSTVTASEVAEYDSETAVAGVSAGTLEANSIGETDVTATVAGESDTVTVEVLEPPNIELVDAEFDSEGAVDGALVEATVTYENTGGPGSETATVSVDGTAVTTTTVPVDADGETTETLEWAADEAGSVAVDETDVGELTLYEPGTVGLESIAVPEAAAQDSEYAIDLELTNDADQPVTETVDLRVDGDEVATESVTVEPGGSTESIIYAHDEQGTATHVVVLQDEEETATMEILEPAEFVLADLEAPETVSVGETTTVTATVENVGGGEDDADVSLVVDGEAVATQSVTLAVGESESLEFETTADETGDVGLVVESPDDALEATIAVDADDGISGFGTAVALVAVVIAAGIASRRR
ncbi:hypothetical protein D8Y22_13250 [Salinadaptatus halalkaliphilus]|uniref:CARDB domain-containing protein n=2 Tax=Salinadaptatus halalkaliphilus TaxID=2419781 RepID=A0A4S3TK89_9EURY|nr:hypothetical protein D8Y22_13250 [Salinadaptatus halalkaliphilus]